MKPIALFGTGIKSVSASITAQRRVNCFYDVRTDEDKTKIAVRGTPGALTSLTLSDSPIRGWRVVGDYMYVVAGATVFRVSADSAYIILGTIPNSGQYVTMTDNSLQLSIVDGLRGYYLTLPSGAPTIITDTNFPNGCTTIDTLNSRAIAEVPASRSYYASGQLDVTTWTPVIFGTKENASDNLVAVSVYNGTLVLWGSLNMEFWQDIGSAPNPYQRINGASQTWGLAAKFSRSALSNTIIFLGQNPQGGVQVLMLNGYTPVQVSTSDIENIITSFPIYSDAIGLTYMIDGHPIYQLTFPNAGRTFLFDAKTQMWSEAQSGLVDYRRSIYNLGIVFNSKNYVCDASTGKVYQLSSALYTEDTAPIKRVITSRHVRMDGNEFGISEIVLEIDTGVGVSYGQGADPMIMLRISKDGGKTFGIERWKRMGRQGRYATRLLWDRCGSAKDFVFQFTLTDPVPFNITLAEAVLSPGSEASQ